MNGLGTKWIGIERYHKKETGSTNTDVRNLAGQGSPEGTLVSADLQTAGKGRRGRSWKTEAGTALMFSVLLKPDISPDSAPQITLTMAMAVTKAIRDICGLDARIKWPNDVVVNGKKVCGILTEMDMSADRIDHVIVGTGVNVNQTMIPEELSQSATSLYLETGKQLDKEELLGEITRAFEEYYACFLVSCDMTRLKETYNGWLVSLNREVKVLDPQGEFTGISKGINEKGELLVERSDKKTEAVYAGEVSVRGLYGYV